MGQPLTYRIAQRFYRIESVGMFGARHGDPADPLQLQVVVTPSDNATLVLDSVIAGPGTRDRLWRAAQGLWLFSLLPGSLQPGGSYTANFRFAMTPGNSNVVRQSFVWDSPPALPHDPANCVLYGTMLDMVGQPWSDGHFVLEQYSDYATLNYRTGLIDVNTDAFGNWWIEVPRKALLRAVQGEATTLFVVPDQATANYADVAPYQLANTVQVDRFGYPKPS